MEIFVQPITDDARQITALQQRWIFDPIYAHMLAEPILQAESVEAQQAEWKLLQDDISKTIQAAGYYTFPHHTFVDETEVELINDDGYLIVAFTLPLRQPAQQLTYQIYEPEYYVEMLHAETQDTEFEQGCRLTITPAAPDADKYQEAAALDKDDTGDPMLGRFFAETGIIQC